MRPGSLTWLEAQKMLRARGRDVAVYVVLACLATAAVASGAMASRRVSPASAEAIAAMLARLQQVEKLDNVVLPDEQGRGAPLLARTGRREAVVAFYATDCDACRRALPRLAAAFGADGPLLVVARSGEDPREVRARLDDLGLRNLGFVIDKFGGLERSARVDVLPTVFRIDGQGRVLERIEGENRFVFERLLRRFDGGVYRRVGRAPTGDVLWEK